MQYSKNYTSVHDLVIIKIEKYAKNLIYDEIRYPFKLKLAAIFGFRAVCLAVFF